MCFRECELRKKRGERKKKRRSKLSQFGRLAGRKEQQAQFSPAAEGDGAKAQRGRSVVESRDPVRREGFAHTRAGQSTATAGLVVTRPSLKRTEQREDEFNLVIRGAERRERRRIGIALLLA